MTKNIPLIIILLTQVVACQQLNTKTDSAPTSSSDYSPITTIASNEITSNDDEDITVYEELPSKEQLLQDLAPLASAETEEYSTRGIGLSTPKSSATRPCRRTIALPFSFPSNSATLTTAGQQYLAGLAEVLSSDKLRDCSFQIESHTDATGATNFNRTLSQQRAEAIKTYLVNQLSLSPSRLKAVGYGEEKPLKRFKPTNSKQRRVQIRLNRS